MYSQEKKQRIQWKNLKMVLLKSYYLEKTLFYWNETFQINSFDEYKNINNVLLCWGYENKIKIMFVR